MRQRPLVILDYDGTIVDSLPSITHATRRTFAVRGLPEPSEDDVRRALHDGRGLEFYLRRLNPTLTEAETESWITEWRAIYAAEAHGLTSPFPGAVEALQRLREEGMILAVMSNKNEPALRASLERLGLCALFVCIVGQLPGRPKKPDPFAYRELIAPALPDHDPARMLMVGDSEADLLFGRAIGARTCFASYGYGDPAQCKGLADEVIGRLAQITPP